MDNLNSHQLKIINSLLFKKDARYTDLNTEELPTNQFNYHIKELITEGYIKKEDDKYLLTTKGKSYASKIDIFSGNIEKQGKLSVLPVCTKIEKGTIKYLIHQRKKHPNYDYIGFPAGKIKYGESFLNEALRELKEETGLSGVPVLKQINHMLVKNKNGVIVDDKLFFIYLITNLKGEFIIETIEGINKWMSLEEVKSQKLLFPDVLDTINILESNELSFVERIDSYEL